MSEYLEIKLENRGKFKGCLALIDQDDLEKIDGYRWLARPSGNRLYVQHLNHFKGGKQKVVHMHRLITNCPPDKIVDHINGNTLDNRKSNLRICTYAENTKNSRKKRNYKKYKCTSFHGEEKEHPWGAYIVNNYKKINLGRFNTEEEAASAYNQAAVRYFGEFAKLNEIL